MSLKDHFRACFEREVSEHTKTAYLLAGACAALEKAGADIPLDVRTWWDNWKNKSK